MFLVKTKNNTYVPSDNTSLDQSNKIKEGTEVKASKARNPEFHRKYFALLKLGLENTDTEDPKEIYRMKIQMRAGFVVWGKDSKGESYPFPQSISFESMSETRFQEVYSAVVNIIAGDLDVSKDGLEAEIEGYM